jgi:CIC family chloride channel protein
MALRDVKLRDVAGSWADLNLERFRKSHQPIVWLLAPLIGLATGAAAILFRLAIGVFQLPWLHTMSERVAAAAREQP